MAPAARDRYRSSASGSTCMLAAVRRMLAGAGVRYRTAYSWGGCPQFMPTNGGYIQRQGRHQDDERRHHVRAWKNLVFNLTHHNHITKMILCTPKIMM